MRDHPAIYTSFMANGPIVNSLSFASSAVAVFARGEYFWAHVAAGLGPLESTVGLYKTELINQRGPWKAPTDVELATAEFVDWFNTGDCTPPSARSAVGPGRSLAYSTASRKTVSWAPSRACPVGLAEASTVMTSAGR